MAAELSLLKMSGASLPTSADEIGSQFDSNLAIFAGDPDSIFHNSPVIATMCFLSDLDGVFELAREAHPDGDTALEYVCSIAYRLHEAFLCDAEFPNVVLRVAEELQRKRKLSAARIRRLVRDAVSPSAPYLTYFRPVRISDAHGNSTVRIRRHSFARPSHAAASLVLTLAGLAYRTLDEYRDNIVYDHQEHVLLGPAISDGSLGRAAVDSILRELSVQRNNSVCAPGERPFSGPAITDGSSVLAVLSSLLGVDHEQ